MWASMARFFVGMRVMGLIVVVQISWKEGKGEREGGREGGREKR